MPYRQTMIGALMIVDERAAADHLLTALNEHDGNTVATAAALEVDHSTLKRWLRRLESRDWNVKDEAAAMRTKAKTKLKLKARRPKPANGQTRGRRRR